MRRSCVIGVLLMLAFCSTAQAQVETVVVTASLSVTGIRAQKFLAAAQKRLTAEGRAFVLSQGKRVYDGAVDIETARAEAEESCAKAFETCADKDAFALTGLTLESALSDALPDGERLLSGIPPSQSAHTTEQMLACGQRNDLKCARKVLLKSLPPERREAFEQMVERLDGIRYALNRVLASAGFKKKDDK